MSDSDIDIEEIAFLVGVIPYLPLNLPIEKLDEL